MVRLAARLRSRRSRRLRHAGRCPSTPEQPVARCAAPLSLDAPARRLIDGHPHLQALRSVENRHRLLAMLALRSRRQLRSLQASEQKRRLRRHEVNVVPHKAHERGRGGAALIARSLSAASRFARQRSHRAHPSGPNSHLFVQTTQSNPTLPELKRKRMSGGEKNPRGRGVLRGSAQKNGPRRRSGCVRIEGREPHKWDARRGGRRGGRARWQ
jgi:hypothetical protein